MNERNLTSLQCIVVDEQPELSLPELCRELGLAAEELVAYVEEGILEPRGRTPREWRFGPLAVERLRMALRLQHDLGMNLAGTAVALDLIAETRRLRRRIRLLEQLLDLD